MTYEAALELIYGFRNVQKLAFLDQYLTLNHRKIIYCLLVKKINNKTKNNKKKPYLDV